MMYRQILKRVECGIIVLLACAFIRGAAQDSINIVQVDIAAFPEVSLRVTSALRTGGGMSAESFDLLEDGVRVPILRYQSNIGSRVIDIAYVFDDTGSMLGFIQAVKTTSIYLAETLDSVKSDYRLGLITFKDEIGRIRNFTNSVSEFRRWVDPLVADGGGDTEESSLDALARAVDWDFRSHASKKALVLITDAPPHRPGLVDPILERIRRKNLVVYAITPDIPVYRKLTNGSGGALFNIAAGSSSELITKVIDLIVGNFQLVYRSPRPEKDGSHRIVKVSLKGVGSGSAEYVVPQDKEKPPQLIWDTGQKDEFGQDEDLKFSGAIRLQGWDKDRISSFKSQLTFTILGQGGEQFNSANNPALFRKNFNEEDEKLKFSIELNRNLRQGSYRFVVNHSAREIGQRQFTVVDPLFTYILYRIKGGREDEFFNSSSGSATTSETLYQNDEIRLVIQPTSRYASLSPGTGTPPRVTLDYGTESRELRLTLGGGKWVSDLIPLEKVGNYRIESTATIPGGTRARFAFSFSVEGLSFTLKWLSTPQNPIFHGQVIKVAQGAVSFPTGRSPDWEKELGRYHLIYEARRKPDTLISKVKIANTKLSDKDKGFLFEVPVPTDSPGNYQQSIKVMRAGNQEIAQALDFDYEVLVSPLHIFVLANESGGVLIDSRNESDSVKLWTRNSLLVRAIVDFPYQIRSSLAKIMDKNGNQITFAPLSRKEKGIFEGKIDIPESSDDFFVSVATELEPSPGASANVGSFSSEFRYRFHVESVLAYFLKWVGLIFLTLTVAASAVIIKKAQDVKGLPRLAGSVWISSKEQRNKFDIGSVVKGRFKRSVKIGFDHKCKIPITPPAENGVSGASFEIGLRKTKNEKPSYELYLLGIKDSEAFRWEHGPQTGRLRDGIITRIRDEITGRVIDVIIGSTSIRIELEDSTRKA